MISRFQWLAAILTLILALSAATVLAHEAPARSNPADGSVIPTAPAQITITFPGELDATGSSIRVLDPDGKDITPGSAGLDLENPDRNMLVAPLAGDLPNGRYTVDWVALSLADGHKTTGDFSFTVDPNAPAPTAQSAASPTSATSVGAASANPTASGGDTSGKGSSNAKVYFAIGAVAVVALSAAAASVLAQRARKQSR